MSSIFIAFITSLERSLFCKLPICTFNNALCKKRYLKLVRRKRNLDFLYLKYFSMFFTRKCYEYSTCTLFIAMALIRKRKKIWKNHFQKFLNVKRNHLIFSWLVEKNPSKKLQIFHNDFHQCFYLANEKVLNFICFFQKNQHCLPKHQILYI